MTIHADTQAKLRGIHTALLTPMHDDGSIDYASLTRLVEHQIRQGIAGFYVGGSTGEGFILTSEERKQVLETVVRSANGRVAVIAHVGCISTAETIALAKHAEALKVDAISAVVPFYYKLSMNEIYEHYAAIMSAVQVPMIVYHYPGATGVSLSTAFYEKIAQLPSCIGVKFTSMNVFEMQQIRAKCGAGFLIFNGSDEIYAAGAITGADGAIGSTFNMMPHLFIRMFQQASAHNWQAIVPLQTEANEVIAHMLNYDVIPYEKYILYLQGIVQNPTARQPLKKLSSDERKQIEVFFQQCKTLHGERNLSQE